MLHMEYHRSHSSTPSETSDGESDQDSGNDSHGSAIEGELAISPSQNRYEKCVKMKRRVCKRQETDSDETFDLELADSGDEAQSQSGIDPAESDTDM
jgi:hypothetical protein